MERAELLKALEIVKPGLADKEVIEQTTSFAFIGDKVVTYNDEISISHPLDGLNVKGVVPADELYKFLGKAKGDAVKITANENELRLKAGKAKIGLALTEDVRLPLEEIKSKKKWFKLPEEFTTAINFTSFSCSADMSRPNLTCIHVRQDGVIESSDGYRITQYEMPEKMPIPTFLLPGTTAREVLKYDIKKVSLSSGWVHFRTKEGTMFSCRIYEDATFPDTSSHLEVEGREILFPENIKEILSRAAIFAKADHYIDEAVTLSFKKNKVQISARNAQGWFREKAKVSYKGEEHSFKMNPNFLSDIVDQLRECILSEKMAKFSGDNWIHVMSLVG